MDLSFDPVVRWITAVRDFGLERAARRYYGLYIGEVVSNQDEHQEGKIAVGVGVLGFGRRQANGVFRPSALAVKAMPGSPYAGEDHGFYFPPEEGDRVWVSFDHGDPTQPRYHGSFWRNPNPARTSASSHVPAEFKSADGIPRVRGIKTKRGNGLAFSDDPNDPYVEIWTGEQVTPGERAERRHQLSLTESPGGSGIFAQTFGDFAVELDDTTQKITVRGRPLDPAGQFVNAVEIDEKFGTVTIKTKAQQQIILDDKTQTITVTTPGTLLVGATGGISLGSGIPAGAPPTPGTMVEKGGGNKIIEFLGTVTESITGAYTQNLLGALTQIIAGNWNVTAPLIQHTSIDIRLGNPASAVALVKEELLTWLATHSHPGPGAPPAQATDLTNPATKPLYVTSNLKAT